MIFNNLLFKLLNMTDSKTHDLTTMRAYLNDHYVFNRLFDSDILTFNFPIANTIDDFIKMIGDIKYTRENYNISFKNVNIIDVLGLLYPSYPMSNPLIISNGESLYILLNNLLDKRINRLPTLGFFKNDPLAVSPTKAHYSDSGYDLTIIKKVKDIGKNTAMYDTGISLQIPIGYQIHISPRSSLSKSGYILTNSTGIIDVGYTGNLFICLTRTEPIAYDLWIKENGFISKEDWEKMNNEEKKSYENSSLPELILPFKCCQMILKKCEYCHLEEKVKEKVIESSRGDGSFGSSNKN